MRNQKVHNHIRQSIAAYIEALVNLPWPFRIVLLVATVIVVGLLLTVVWDLIIFALGLFLAIIIIGALLGSSRGAYWRGQIESRRHHHRRP